MRNTKVSNFKKVKEFMSTFGQTVRTVPVVPSPQVMALRYELIAEELAELSDAMYEEDLIEVADALTDLLYVVYGAGHTFGIDLDECFAEVHRSNMSKLGPDGEPIYRSDGKVLKGPEYSEPDLGSVLYGD